MEVCNKRSMIFVHKKGNADSCSELRDNTRRYLRGSRSRDSRNMTERESVDLLIRGGRLLDPGSDIVGAGDIVVKDGKILAVGKDLHSRFLQIKCISQGPTSTGVIPTASKLQRSTTHADFMFLLGGLTSTLMCMSTLQSSASTWTNTA